MKVGLTAAAVDLGLLLTLAACDSERPPLSPSELQADVVTDAKVKAPLAVTPTSLTFTAIGEEQAETLTVTSRAGGFLTSSSPSCAGIATVSSGKVHIDRRHGTFFIVTPLGVGNCTVVVTDKKGNAASVAVTVMDSQLRLPQGLSGILVPPCAVDTATQTFKGAVVVLVEPELSPHIRESVSMFVTDLCASGYSAGAVASSFATPTQLRQTLRAVYGLSEGLQGAVLVGAFPRAYQYVQLFGVYPAAEEAISYQFYSDLDGNFSASSGYSSPGGHEFSYDVHDGAVDWEIWIGVLPRQGDLAASAASIIAYFAKNHAYRVGANPLPRRFLQVSELTRATTPAEEDVWLQGLREEWAPWSDAPDALNYFDRPSGVLGVWDGYTSLTTGVADFFHGAAHGWPGGHGRLTIAWVRSNAIRVTFFWSDGCSVANLDVTPNLMTEILYSPSSLVVAGKGTTNNSGGLGTNEDGPFGSNIARRMDHGENLGQAVVYHVNVPLLPGWVANREFLFGTLVLLGDPTLTVGPQHLTLSK